MEHPIRLRALLLGIVAGILICAVTPYNNNYLNATPLGGGHFPLAPFFIASWLTLLAGIFNRLTGKSILSGLEILSSWILMVVVSGIPYTGLARTFFINLTAPMHFATPGNNWAEELHPLLPTKLYPQDQQAVSLLYDGLPGGLGMSVPELFSNIPWAAWSVPLLWWGIFIFLCYFLMICLTNLFSRQWIENERVNFPLLQLPKTMEEALDGKELGHVLTDNYLLSGILIVLILHTINGLSLYYPSVPQIPTVFLAGKYFPKYGLFSGFHKLKIYIYPAFIGFAFLTSRQISFSFWAMFLICGLLSGILALAGLSIPASIIGVSFGPTLSSIEETQMIGAFTVFALFIIFLARHHLLMATKAAFWGPSEKQAETEWFSLRLTVWGLILGFLLLSLWCVFFGMPFFTAITILGLFFLFAFVTARIICQGGIAYFTLTTAPMDTVLGLLGAKFFTAPAALLAAAMQKALFVDMRESLMPSLMHGAKISETVRNKRLFFAGLMAILILGVVTSFAAMLALCYKYGLRELEVEWATRTTIGVYDNVRNMLANPAEASPWVRGFALTGAVVMLVLVFCYRRFYWWPLHPIGYLTAYSSAMRILWFSFLIGWMINNLTLRYGGIQLFKKVRYFFFGLILGDFLMGGLWALIGYETGISYLVLPD